MQGVADIKN